MTAKKATKVYGLQSDGDWYNEQFDSIEEALAAADANGDTEASVYELIHVGDYVITTQFIKQ